MKVKQILILLLTVIASFITFSCESNDGVIPQGTSNLTSKSKVLVEFFTNTSCVGCPAAGNYLNRIHDKLGVTINDTNVVILAVHTTMFPNDPFHLFNTTDNLSRQQYYNAGSFNPVAYTNGTLMPVPFDQNGWTSQINQYLNILNSFGLNVTNTFDTTSRTGTLVIQIGQFSGSQISDLKLLIAVTESNLHYNAPNGETDFNNVMRALITPGSGQSINVIPGQSINVVKDYTIDSRLVLANCKLVIFVQSLSSKEVFGVESINLLN
jgi:hypothetical protein